MKKYLTITIVTAFLAACSADVTTREFRSVDNTVVAQCQYKGTDSLNAQWQITDGNGNPIVAGCDSLRVVEIGEDGHPATVSQDNYQLSSQHHTLEERIINCQLKNAPKIFKETCEIQWSKTAKQVYDFVRGLSPVPGAWTTLVTPDGRETVLKIYKARKTERPCLTGSGSIAADGKTLCIGAADEWLEVVELQLAGKKRMAARDFLNGMKDIGAYTVR